MDKPHNILPAVLIGASYTTMTVLCAALLWSTWSANSTITQLRRENSALKVSLATCRIRIENSRVALPQSGLEPAAQAPVVPPKAVSAKVSKPAEKPAATAVVLAGQAPEKAAEKPVTRPSTPLSEMPAAADQEPAVPWPEIPTLKLKPPKAETIKVKPTTAAQTKPESTASASSASADTKPSVAQAVKDTAEAELSQKAEAASQDLATKASEAKGKLQEEAKALSQARADIAAKSEEKIQQATDAAGKESKPAPSAKEHSDSVKAALPNEQANSPADSTRTVAQTATQETAEPGYEPSNQAPSAKVAKSSQLVRQIPGQGDWIVQFGAYPTESKARSDIERLARKLEKAGVTLTLAIVHDGAWWKILVPERLERIAALTKAKALAAGTGLETAGVRLSRKAELVP